MNPKCRTCPTAHDSLNGRYCRLLRRYVEYATQAPCITPENES